METDGGGWTLFYAYKHNPEEDYDLDATHIPTNPEDSKSHINLSDKEVGPLDVTELRFFCTTNNDNKFIHFRTSSPELIKIAMTGD
jgi:hypothetical protein